MKVPAVGTWLRIGGRVRVVHVEEATAEGNVPCIVVTPRGEWGWIVYYPQGGHSNVNFFPEDEAETQRARLEATLAQLDAECEMS